MRSALQCGKAVMRLVNIALGSAYVIKSSSQAGQFSSKTVKVEARKKKKVRKSRSRLAGPNRIAMLANCVLLLNLRDRV